MSLKARDKRYDHPVVLPRWQYHDYQRRSRKDAALSVRKTKKAKFGPEAIATYVAPALQSGVWRANSCWPNVLAKRRHPEETLARVIGSFVSVLLRRANLFLRREFKLHGLPAHHVTKVVLPEPPVARKMVDQKFESQPFPERKQLQ